MEQTLSQIPTNLITGFLGVGKTTLIQQLLRGKPREERWAVLVNEFGEIGIDGALLESGREYDPEHALFIREVPGGCLCCAASVPMQVALNQLLKQAQPHRLLIEPTGLGHPQQILAALSQPAYQGVLDLRATLTLVDARNINDPRYTEQPTFNQQLQIADLIVAHKSDRYVADELDQLRHYLSDSGLTSTPLYAAAQGEIDPALLDIAPLSPFALHDHPSTGYGVELPASGFLSQNQRGDHFISRGWTFGADHIFGFNAIHSLFESLEVVRLKAVVITERGSFAYNKIEGEIRCTAINNTPESRVEVIDTDLSDWEQIESDLQGSRLAG